MIAAALVLSAALAQGYYTKEEAQDLFAQGNAAHDRGDHEAAMQAWQRLVDRGYDSQDVLYNLGTAALHKGDLGRAVLYLERAARRGPMTEDLESNLEAARERQGDKVVGAGGGDSFVVRIARATPGNAVAIAFLVSWIGGFVFVFVFRFQRPGRRLWTAVASAALFALAVPSGLLLAAHVHASRSVQEGVVLTNTLRARELPSEDSKVSFEVHAGLKVRLLQTDGRFVQIRLPNGLVGWTEKEGIAEI